MRLDDVLGVFMAISQQTIFDAPVSLTVNRQVGESTCKASLPLFGPYTGAHFPFHSSYMGGPSKRLTRSYLYIIKRKFLLSTRRGGVVARGQFHMTSLEDLTHKVIDQCFVPLQFTVLTIEHLLLIRAKAHGYLSKT
jgi:hypothetical protein